MKDDTIESNGAQCGPFFLSHCQHFIGNGEEKSSLTSYQPNFGQKVTLLLNQSERSGPPKRGFYVLNVLY